jgi:hypothetical protein
VPRFLIAFCILIASSGVAAASPPRLTLNERDYFSMPGLDSI